MNIMIILFYSSIYLFIKKQYYLPIFFWIIRIQMIYYLFHLFLWFLILLFITFMYSFSKCFVSLINVVVLNLWSVF
jgi:hypothetical protein